MQLVKTTSSVRIRNFCIEHKFYSTGDNKAYNHLLYVIVDEANLTDIRIEKIADDIMLHSNCKSLIEANVRTTTDMMNLLLDEAINVYYNN